MYLARAVVKWSAFFLRAISPTPRSLTTTDLFVMLTCVDLALNLWNRPFFPFRNVADVTEHGGHQGEFIVIRRQPRHVLTLRSPCTSRAAADSFPRAPVTSSASWSN